LLLSKHPLERMLPYTIVFSMILIVKVVQ